MHCFLSSTDRELFDLRTTLKETVIWQTENVVVIIYYILISISSPFSYQNISFLRFVEFYFYKIIIFDPFSYFLKKKLAVWKMCGPARAACPRSAWHFLIFFIFLGTSSCISVDWKSQIYEMGSLYIQYVLPSRHCFVTAKISCQQF